jgi:type II secretory pathway component PulF
MSFIAFSGVVNVLVLGASMVIAASVLARAAPRTGASESVLRTSGYVLLAVGLLGGCLAVAGWLGFLAWPIAMVIWTRAAVNYRATQKQNLLSALAVAIGKRMPLAPMALAFADEQERGFAGRARALAERLEQGVPVAEALRRSRRALPPESALAAAVGLESGDLSAALDATTYASVFERTWLQPAISRLVYIAVAIAVFLGISAYMQFKIIPSWIAILEDFDIHATPANVSVGLLPRPDFVDTLYGWLLLHFPPALSATVMAGGLTLLLTLVAGLLLLVVWLYLWLQWRGTLYPRLPGFRSIITWVDMGPVLRVLALAARRNRPLLGMLTAIARLHPKRSIRGRMRRVVRDLDNGIPWHEGLRRQRLINATDGAILAAAGDSGNLAWALSEMADGFERKATYRLQAISQTVVPLLLLPLGAITALMAVSYFIPLSVLVERLS